MMFALTCVSRWWCWMHILCQCLSAIDTSWVNELRYPTKMVNVKTEFNATGDGQTYDTIAIQAAIDAVSNYVDPNTSIAGGIVFFPAGHYLSGQLELRSNTFLHLSKQSTLYASADVAHYPSATSEWQFLVAKQVSNIGIFGDGVINGQSHKYVSKYDLYLNKLMPQPWPNCTGECRPKLIGFQASTNITLQGTFSLLNSPDWTVLLWSCANVLVDGVQIWNDRRWPNGDGIDPQNVQNMVIRNVRINTGDDGICFKSERDAWGNLPPTRNILVQNAWISSHSCAIKIGSTTNGLVHDIRVENVTIVDSNRGLGIQMRDNGSVYDVSYEHIHIETRWWDQDVNSWWGDGEPIWITSIVRSEDQSGIGTVHDIRFTNISIRSENGVFISGIGDPSKRGQYQNVYNIVLENIDMLLDKWFLYQHPSIDYRPSYGEYGECIDSLVDGLRIEYSRNVSIRNFALTFVMNDLQRYWNDCYNVSQTNHDISFTDFTCNRNETARISHREL